LFEINKLLAIDAPYYQIVNVLLKL